MGQFAPLSMQQPRHGPQNGDAVKLIPLGDNVIVRRLETEERSTGGILLPEAARGRSQQGRVLAVGDGRLAADGVRVPLQVREGDRVFFAAYSGSEVQVNGEKLLILHEGDVLAVLE